MKSLPIYALVNVLNTYAYVEYASIWENRRRKWYVYVGMFVLAYMADITVYFYGDFFPALYSISSLLIIFVLLLFHTNNPLSSIFKAAVFLVVGVICEIVATYCVCGFNGISMEEALNNKTEYALILIISKTFQLLFVFIYRNKNRTDVNQVSVLGVVVVFIGSILILDIMVAGVFNINDDSQLRSLLIIMAVTIVINIITYTLYRRQSALYAIELQNKILMNYIENQNIEHQNNIRMQERERILRHDMKNYMILLKQYAEEKNTEKIIGFINEKFDIVEHKEVAIHTGCGPIDIILFNKIRASKEKDINISTDIQLLDMVDYKFEDLIVILGNLLDNAIEAVEDCDEKEIHVRIKCDKGMFITEITNPVSQKIDIPKSGFIKTSKIEKGHGFGLKSIKDISEKYDGDLILSCENKIFTAKVVLFKRMDN